MKKGTAKKLSAPKASKAPKAPKAPAVDHAARAAALHAQLKQLEWSGPKKLTGGPLHREESTCPKCGAMQHTRQHEENCELAKLLAESAPA
jgi:hypothetical protein